MGDGLVGRPCLPVRPISWWTPPACVRSVGRPRTREAKVARGRVGHAVRRSNDDEPAVIGRGGADGPLVLKDATTPRNVQNRVRVRGVDRTGLVCDVRRLPNRAGSVARDDDLARGCGVPSRRAPAHLAVQRAGRKDRLQHGAHMR